MPAITDQENGLSVRNKLNLALGLHVNLQSGTSYTLVAEDHSKLIAMSSATEATVIVSGGLPADFYCIVAQVGEGEVTVEGSGATVHAFMDVFTLPGQYATATLYCLSSNDFLLTLGGGAAAPAPPIDASHVTSAGVFDATGKLVRVLWTAELDHPGLANPAGAWDGTLDDGSVAPTGGYTVKLIGHNTQYTWEGAIGNTSPNHDTVTYHAYGSVIRDMAITDAGEMYFSTVYDERIQTFRVMLTSDIQNSVTAVPPQGFRQAIIAAHAVCTDGTIAYLGITNESENGVIGTDCATKIKVTFPSGTVIGTLSYLGVNTNPAYEGQITGLAVQKTGSYIFLARPLLPGIQVYNKTSAAFVSTFAGLAHPRRLASNPVTITELWVAEDTTGDGLADIVVKCAVDGAGTITTTATTIACQNALALAISPDGSTLLIADGGTSQQVKAYNTSDGSVRGGWGVSGVLGTAGGYVNSPAVTDTKFMFHAIQDMGSGEPQAFIAYQADGKFWLGDVGNCRYLRFSAGEAPALVDYFSYIPGFYPCRVCKNNPTRIFATFKEYEIDYTKVLSPTNGSWVLKNNWAGNVIDQFPTIIATAGSYNCLKYVGEYSNGRTYGMLDLTGIAARRWFELTSTGLRDTGMAVVPQGYIDADMHALFPSSTGPGFEFVLRRNAFTGFNGTNDPTYTLDDGNPPDNRTALYGEEVLLLSETLPAKFPNTKGMDNNMVQHLEQTASGVIPFFDTNTGYDPGWFNNHFGTIDAATGAVKSNTHPLTPTRHGGSGRWCLLYPPPPYIPYNVVLGGGIMVYEPGHEHVFTNFNGEEWGNNQTNVLQHWHESGLCLGQFGPAAPYFGAYSLRRPDLLLGDDIPRDDPWSFLGMRGLTGNSRWGGLAFVNNKYYIYQNDEWYHGGITRWRVDNLDPVLIENYPVGWDSSSYIPVSDPPDMLKGLPFDAVLVDGTANWHRSHPDDGTKFKAFTGGVSCDFRKPDIVLEAAEYTDDVLRSISRDLIRSGSGNWTLEGDIIMYPGMTRDTNPFIGGLILHDILDSTGKVILRWYGFHRGEQGLAGTIVVNGMDLFPMPADPSSFTWTYLGAVRSFSVAANVGAGTMLFTYDVHQITVPVFEVGAAIGDPDLLRLGHDAHNSAGTPRTCITRLRFE